MAMTASSSGRRIDPPSIVIVPSQLMTVPTPNSSYGFPVWPKPVTAGLLAPEATFEKSFRGVSKDVARAAAVPRNPRRFQRESSPMVISFGLLVSYSGDAIDLDQRVSWQSGNSNGGTRRTSVREIRGEDFVHPVPVLNVGQ